MSVFTDDDLAQLKGDLENRLWDTLGISGAKALVARLEAAEDLILNHSITPIGYDSRYAIWKKAAGK